MLFIYFSLTLNWGFDRNSACTYLKSHQACWAADKGLGISPQGCGEYRQEARDRAPDQNFLGGGWSRARHPAQNSPEHTGQSTGLLPGARWKRDPSPDLWVQTQQTAEGWSLPQGEADTVRLEPSILAQPLPPHPTPLRRGGNWEGTFQRAFACRVWKWNKSICK